METTKVFTVEVPNFIFPGFYNTEFDPDSVLQDDGEEEVYDDHVTAAEYYMDAVVGRIVDHYKEVFPHHFKLISYNLESPKEYNYKNDKIVLEIETTYENIVYYFFSYEEDNLMDYLHIDQYNDDKYHEAMLEVLLEFWPFDGSVEHDMELKENFIYG